jgi:hypothetical protein
MPWWPWECGFSIDDLTVRKSTRDVASVLLPQCSGVDKSSAAKSASSSPSGPLPSAVLRPRWTQVPQAISISEKPMHKVPPALEA